MKNTTHRLTLKYTIAMIIAAAAVLASYLSNQVIMHDLLSDQNNISERIYTYKNMQLFLLSATFFILALIVHFIFRPMVSHISNQIEQLEKTEARACEANRLKSEFIATMSHEIRSPMTGVLGMAELMLKSNLNDDQRGYAKTIYRSGETLLNIIEDVLDFSKIEANKIELVNEPVDLVDLLDDLCMLYYPMAREKALELVVRYVPGSEQWFIADPVRLRQIFGNLINNAIKFTDSGHIIITVSENKNDDPMFSDMVITIQDTGIGIAEDKHEDVFKTFQQADSSTTRNYGGTGLGLTVCRRLVEMMNGTIDLKSQQGRGSVFTVKLPLERDKRAFYMPEKPFELQDIKILVVDDLAIIQKLLHEQLSLTGMICHTAGGGEEALRILSEAADQGAPYDIVMIDYVMAGMNGDELAEKIKGDPHLSGACLIMLTAAGNPIHKETFINHGFSAYLPKPFKNEELVSNIAEIWTAFKKGNDGEWLSLSHEGDSGADVDYALKGVDILLVEDSRLNQAFAKEVLEDTGARVVTASHGKEAIEILSENDGFDLILMDCQMPILDGFEATKTIRKIESRKNVREPIPIIALTANAMKGDRRKCLNAGMDDYLAKPVRSDDLIDMVLKFTSEDSPLNKSQNIVRFNRAKPVKNKNGIDEDALENVKKVFGVQYPDIIKIFIEDGQSYMDQVKSALESNLMQEAILPAHTLKSTGRRIGAEALSNIAENLEKHLITGDGMPAKTKAAYLKDLEYEFKFVKSYLERDLQAHETKHQR